MKRVSIVNLSGRAFHVEDDGVAAIEAWLADASSRLAADPDRDELLADFEHAIADKCDVHVAGDRDVVTGEQVRAALDSMGTIELPSIDADDQPTEPMATAAQAASTWRERRLYRLTGEGESMLAGVCSGLAAYLNVDVTVIRLLTVLIGFATGGVAIIVYIVMALIVPEADTPGKRAAVRGYGETAQELMSRARDGAGPALASLGSLIRSVWTFIAKVIRWIFLAITWLLLTAWAVAVSWLLLDGDEVLSAFDDGASRWLIVLWVTCAAWILVSIAFGITALMRRLTPGVERRRTRYGVATATAWGASVIAAFIGLWAIPFTNSTQLRDLSRDGQGRLELFGETYCFRDPANPEPPTARERCRAGDEIVDGDAYQDDGRVYDWRTGEWIEPAAPAEPAEPAEPARPAR
jgi:phage shock protein PspC (stress-responsive transcriptional regulator)